MAVYTPKRFFQNQPTTSYPAPGSSPYIVPAATSAVVKEIVVCNVTAGPVSIDVAFVASGGTAGVTNSVIVGHVIPPLTTVIYGFSQVLATGGFVSAKASVSASLTVSCSGVEIT